ncbi:MAG: hypothetical protein LBU32_11735 [Clostridiales bacterium]|jgi:hypothetical protein|nr:hypothetical protein [Clostridiales bacterium]
MQDQSLITSRLFFGAAFPVMRAVLEYDSVMAEKFKDVSATVQIGAKDQRFGLIACHLVFDDLKLDIVDGSAENPDIALTFSSLDKMNAMFKGGFSVPQIKGFSKPRLLLKILSLLMSLKLMLPSTRPKDPEKQALKVRMSLYMITRALSVANKMGMPDIVEWTKRQPDRIYQFSVEASGIAAYLRVKAGKTKSGHGIYQRRSPFVLFRFMSVEGALKVLLKEVAFVSGVEQGCVEIVGSPEYASQLNDLMAMLQGMLT